MMCNRASLLGINKGMRKEHALHDLWRLQRPAPRRGEWRMHGEFVHPNGTGMQPGCFSGVYRFRIA